MSIFSFDPPRPVRRILGITAIALFLLNFSIFLKQFQGAEPRDAIDIRISSHAVDLESLLDEAHRYQLQQHGQFDTHRTFTFDFHRNSNETMCLDFSDPVDGVVSNSQETIIVIR